MKTPLILLTACYTVSFFDGMFEWGLADGFYILTGLVMLVSIGWMWKIELGNKEK